MTTPNDHLPISPSAMPEANDVLVQRYCLEREAGRSEVGVVFEAKDLPIGRRVAVEVASSLHEPRARRKWLRDAMLAQRLEGEHVLRVLDVGTLPSGVPFVVREAAMCTLSSEVESRGVVPVQQAVAWTLEACEAVAEAHALGMAHGDLRLDNMVLARGAFDPIVKVAWTSAAKAERAAREDVARDIAGLGAMLRVLATGRTDDEADGASTLPSNLVHAVARALSQTQEAAFRNVAELARALAPFAPPGHASARSVALLLSRAGIVSGGGSSIEIVPKSTRRPSAPPSQASEQAAEASALERDRVSFADEWFNRASRPPMTRRVAPPPKRQTAFALVSIALIAGVIGGSWLLVESGRLPHWTGSAPAEPVGTSEITSGTPDPATAEDNAKPNELGEAEDLAPVAIDSLPNAPPTTTSAIAAPVAPPPAAPAAPATPPSTPTDDSTSTSTESPAPAEAPAAPEPAPAPPSDSLY